MHRPFKSVKDCIRTNPLPLLAIKDKKLLNIAENALRYDTGIEIECHMKSDYKESMFREIPNIINVNSDSDEQRYRIPTGIKGLICLYDLCEKLKQYSVLNPGSGIHYHINCTEIDFVEMLDSYTNIYGRPKVNLRNNWILSSLKSWNYTGDYNEWKLSYSKSAVRVHERYKTVEFRIGEMSFDYEVLIKRIIHCQNIVQKMKYSLMSPKLRTKLSS